MNDLLDGNTADASRAMGTLSPSSLLGGLNAKAAANIYKPLKAGEIRVVKLHPAAELRNDLHCSLETVQLSQKPQYEALSYVWGNQNDPETIILNGHEFKVTQNLNAALRHLRRPDSERLLWIDALTINQSDTLEKNSQVWQMATIYSLAAKAVVWLGKGDDDVQKLFNFVAAFSVDWDNFVPRSLDIIGNRAIERLFQTVNLFQVVEMLPYWSRAWVVQEGKYSAKTELVYGFQCIHSLALRSLLVLSEDYLRETVSNGLLTAPGAVLAGSILGVQTYSTMRRQLDVIQDSDFLTPSRWIQFFCERQCQDPRDKVFSFYNCFAPRIRNSINVDYSKSTSEVFASMTRALIDYTGHLGFLHITDLHERGASAPTRLPSWCPNFKRRVPFVSFMGKFEVLDIESHQSASLYCFNSNGQLLHLRGRRLSTVGNVRSVPTLGSREHDAEVGYSTHFSQMRDDLTACANVLGVPETGLLKLFALAHLRYPQVAESGFKAKYLQAFTEPVYEDADVNEFQVDPEVFSFFFKLSVSKRPLFACKPVSGLNFPLYGVGVDGMQVGDEIWDIIGCFAPVVLRKSGDSKILVGSIFIEGYETLFSKTFQRKGEMEMSKGDGLDRKEGSGNDLMDPINDLPIEDIVLF
jgi:hypothetical protein